MSPAQREQVLKIECKRWEKSFEKVNGRKPCSADIKTAGDDVQKMYRDYRRHRSERESRAKKKEELKCLASCQEKAIPSIEVNSTISACETKTIDKQCKPVVVSGSLWSDKLFKKPAKSPDKCKKTVVGPVSKPFVRSLLNQYKNLSLVDKKRSIFFQRMASNSDRNLSSVRINSNIFSFFKRNHFFGDRRFEEQASQEEIPSVPIFDSILKSMENVAPEEDESNQSSKTATSNPNSLFDDSDQEDDVVKQVKRQVNQIVTIEESKLLPVDWKKQLQKKKLAATRKKKKKPQENFVRIDLKKKSFASKGYKKFNVQKYKRKQNRALKRNNCYTCRQAGHWAAQCPNKEQRMDSDGIPILDADAIVNVEGDVYQFAGDENEDNHEKRQEEQMENHEIQLFDMNEMMAEVSNYN